MHLRCVCSDPRSMSIQKDLARFEAELLEVADRARRCVSWLTAVQSDDLRFLVAERLPALGAVALPGVVALLDDPGVSGSTRYLAAWVATEVGDRGSCVDALCDEVEAGTQWSLPAAGVLAKHGIAEGVGAVLSALERVDPDDDLSVMGYATALRDLGGALPPELRARLVRGTSRWVSVALAEDFPLH